MSDFLDLTEAQLILFGQNFSVKLAVHDPILTTVVVGDLLTAAAVSTALTAALNAVNSIREDAKEYTRVKDILLYAPFGTPMPVAPTATAWPAFPAGTIAGMLAWYRAIANRIKADPAYTEAIGQDLGIVGTGSAPGTDPPVLNGRTLTGFLTEAGWNRDGHDAAKFQGQRGDETTWTDLGVDIFPPFLDNRAPLVADTLESRRYRAAFMDKDIVTTGWSDTIEIVAQA